MAKVKIPVAVSPGLVSRYWPGHRERAPRVAVPEWRRGWRVHGNAPDLGGSSTHLEIQRGTALGEAKYLKVSSK
jgi:hypothetical protein